MLLSVAEARAARERARTGAAEKGQEAHQWLGERYKRLLESADAIGDLGVAARDTTAFAAGVEASAAQATAASHVAPPAPPVVEKITTTEAAAARAASLAPELWHALDAQNYGGAASCYLAVAALTKRARGALGPVARMLRTRLLEATDAFLRRTDADAASSVYASAVAACVLCDSCADEPGGRALRLFLESRRAWLASTDEDPERALRTAATAVARTVTDLNDLFLEGAFAASAADILRNASAHTGSAVVELDCSVAADGVRAAACDWTRDAVRQARARVSEVLRPERVSETQQLVALRDALKNSCDEDLGEAWRAACASLFVVAGAADAEAASDWRLARSSAARVRADVFYDGEHDKLREVLVGDDGDDADADAATLIARDVRKLCSPWRAAFAPAFAKLVDRRLRHGLKACRKDTERLLKATSDALAKAPTPLEALIHDEEKTQAGDALEKTKRDLDYWQYSGGGAQVDCSASECNWAAARISSWLDERWRACADATVRLGTSENTRASTEAVLSAVAPRFVECVASIAGLLRRRGRDAGRYLRSHAEAEQSAVRDRVRALEEQGEPTCPGRTFRRRANARRTVLPPLVAHETTRRAREDCTAAVIAARVAWSLRYAVVSPVAAAQLCVATSGRASSDQVEAAFDVADATVSNVAKGAAAREAAVAILGESDEIGACCLTEPDVSRDEFYLFCSGALDDCSDVKKRLEAALRDACTVCLVAWASGVVPPLIEAFADDLGGFAHGWQDVLRGDFVLQDPLDPPLPMSAVRDQRDAALMRMREGARWRDRVLKVDDGAGNDVEETAQLPCEPSHALGSTLFQLYMQLAVTVCASDVCATRRHAPPHYKRARRELWRLTAPQLVEAYAKALEGVCDVGALSLLVDAYLLRYVLATRCASSFQADAVKAREDGDEADARDAEVVMRLVADAGASIFERIIDLVDAVDLELYAPFVMHDAVRFYERSRLFFDVLSAHDADVDASIDAGIDWAPAADAPPDDFLDRPPDLIATAPVCPRFPLLEEHDLDDDDDEDEAPADPRFFDPKRFFKKHKLNRRLKEMEDEARKNEAAAAPAPAAASPPGKSSKQGFRKGFLK